MFIAESKYRCVERRYHCFNGDQRDTDQRLVLQLPHCTAICIPPGERQTSEETAVISRVTAGSYDNVLLPYHLDVADNRRIIDSANFEHSSIAVQPSIYPSIVISHLSISQVTRSSDCSARSSQTFSINLHSCRMGKSI